MVVVKFPVKHRQIVSAREMYDQRECPEAMVWDMCRYTRNDHGDCSECPATEQDEDYGSVQRGCYAMAHEACRVALAWQKRLETPSR